MTEEQTRLFERMAVALEKIAGKGDEPATDKQKKYLESLGVTYPEKITKQEASKLIEENK